MGADGIQCFHILRNEVYIGVLCREQQCSLCFWIKKNRNGFTLDLSCWAFGFDVGFDSTLVEIQYKLKFVYLYIHKIEV